MSANLLPILQKDLINDGGQAADLDVMELTAEQVAQAVTKLKTARLALGERFFNDAPTVISNAAKLAVGRSERFFSLAMEAATATGMTRPMAEAALQNAFAPYTDVNLLCEYRDRELTVQPFQRLLPPEVVFHVLAGNLFISGLDSIISATLCGSASLVRCSSSDLIFPKLWVSVLGAVDAQFAGCIRVDHWPAANQSVTGAAAERCDLTVCYGDNQSIQQVRGLVSPGKRFIGHGTRVSFAIVDACSMAGRGVELAKSLAYDFSIYDQQGCLSPRAAFLQNSDPLTLEAFLSSFVQEMRSLAVRLPRKNLSLEEAAAFARARQDSLISIAAGGNSRVLSNNDDGFHCQLSSLGNYTAGCANRFADLRLYSQPDELTEALGKYRGAIGTLGVAGSPDDWMEVAEALSCPRVCAIGQMQKPGLGWTLDGQSQLRNLVDVMTVEES